MVDLTTFYDEHPINEAQIEAAVQRDGKALDHLTPEDLSPHDQDHYGGLAATDVLAAALHVGPGSRVMDVCSGLGGSARYLAHRYGCQVVGVDFNWRRVIGAARLTARVGLAQQVHYVRGDATRLPVAAGSFDAAIGQEAFLHIADKPALLGGCFRSLNGGGGLGFTDWVRRGAFDAETFAALKTGMPIGTINSVAEYERLLGAAGFTDIASEDTSAAWRDILHARYEMFRNMEDDTVRLFGRDRHEAYVEAYRQFIALIDHGSLGGGRFIAIRRR